jgi:hypothetical protein
VATVVDDAAVVADAPVVTGAADVSGTAAVLELGPAADVTGGDVIVEVPVLRPAEPLSVHPAPSNETHTTTPTDTHRVPRMAAEPTGPGSGLATVEPPNCGPFRSDPAPWRPDLLDMVSNS